VKDANGKKKLPILNCGGEIYHHVHLDLLICHGILLFLYRDLG
jgi:hypothetical protein